MTQIDKIEGIRALTNEEIAVVGGGFAISGGSSLSCIIHEIKSIICKVQSLLSCFGGGNSDPG